MNYAQTFAALRELLGDRSAFSLNVSTWHHAPDRVVTEWVAFWMPGSVRVAAPTPEALLDFVREKIAPDSSAAIEQVGDPQDIVDVSS